MLHAQDEFELHSYKMLVGKLESLRDLGILVDGKIILKTNFKI
jgi:hypothetical protein